MPKPKFEFYTRPNGRNEFMEFYKNLTQKDRAKLLAVIAMIEEHGIQKAIQMKWVKKLEDNLFEIRSKQGSDIQRVLYFHAVKGRFVITHGFTKKSQATSKREIQRAKRIRLEFEEENHGNSGL